MLYLNYNRSFSDIYYDENNIADLVSNDVVPAICFNKRGIILEEDSFLWKRPKLNTTIYYNVTTLAQIQEFLINKNYLANAYYKFKGENRHVIIGPGVVYGPDHKILMCLCIRKNTVIDNVDYGNSLDNNFIFDSRGNFIGYNHFILYLATEFFTIPEYEAFYKKIYKDYIQFCYTKGVEVRIVSSQEIEKNTFANEFEINFATITELDYNLKNEVKFLLNNPVSYFVNHNLFIPVEHRPEPPFTEPARTMDSPDDLFLNDAALNMSRPPSLRDRLEDAISEMNQRGIMISDSSEPSVERVDPSDFITTTVNNSGLITRIDGSVPPPFYDFESRAIGTPDGYTLEGRPVDFHHRREYPATPGESYIGGSGIINRITSYGDDDNNTVAGVDSYDEATAAVEFEEIPDYESGEEDTEAQADEPDDLPFI